VASVSGYLNACVSISAQKRAELVQETLKMPHPKEFTQESLKELLFDHSAPKAILGEFADRCDEDFKDLGASKLIKIDAERMHWCFYAKIFQLESNLQKDTRWNVRQKKAHAAFDFLTPIARAFAEANHDSRYLDWEKMISHKFAAWVFFKKPLQGRAPASLPSGD
jgi:hypothetical protein